ncbi:MAG: dipeptide ABC transporter ATP-binding protein [Clostridia bacterium]|nr:dipeptide ABC transporter ATP-binding protein [Clostridia bacterium]MBQ8876993.1 dipeptide ABC transporter ATP-binding protein [Clostridia bacterium]
MSNQVEEMQNEVAPSVAEQATANTPILEVHNLKKYFPVESNFFGKPTRYLRAVDDVSFTLQRGKTIGIVGESGCGKTTMGRSILKLHDITGGQILFDGEDITKYTRSQMRPFRKRMQIIFQDPYSSLSPRLNIGEIIGEAVKVHNIVPASKHKEYVREIMQKCGLQSHFYDRYPHEFSGGQRQRICIARAIALQPELIICDEPVSALDVSIQAQIINLLKDMQKEMNIAYVFISHDLSVVEHISDEIAVMYLGNMVEKGPKTNIFANPLHPYTQALFSAIPNPDPRVKMHRQILRGDIPSPSNPPSGCKFHTRCEKCMEICKTQVPVSREVEPEHFVACHLYNDAKGNADE